MKAGQSIKQWAEQLKNYQPVQWERMPELELYMDQVTSYLNRQLVFMQRRAEDNPPLTSSMINNYVKDGLITRPEQKKYKKEQLAGLLMICGMKQTLSMPDISNLLSALNERCASEDLYQAFSALQSGAFEEVCRRLLAVDPAQKELLEDLALALTLEANARRAAAEKIISALQEEAEASASVKHHAKKDKDETNERV